MPDKALDWIQRLPQGAIVLPERRPDRARAAVLSWRDAYAEVEIYGLT